MQTGYTHSTLTCSRDRSEDVDGTVGFVVLPEPDGLEVALENLRSLSLSLSLSSSSSSSVDRIASSLASM